MGVHKPDGDLTWILINTQPIFGDDGQKPSAVVASFTDITTLKWMSESLQQSEYRFRIISEIISNYAYGFAVLPTGEVSREWLVGAFETITGYTSNEIDTQSLWISIIYPEDLPIANRRMERLLAGQESTDEFRIVTASGKILWIQDNSKPIWDDKAGRVVYIFGAARDITARKLAEQQKLDLNTERERINILADFITSTSHELRTPLSIINTSLYLLMHTQDETKRQTKARQITDQVSYLNKVINQLHEVVRLDRLSGLELTPLSMRAIVEIFLNTYLPHQLNMVFEVDISSDLPLIVGNDYYIQTILEHVISNAIHFSVVGGKIRLSAHIDNGYVALDIADTGEGIASQHLDHIFDPFYKASSARTHGDSGVGIGLTIVRRIMELHHGRVAVKSKLGEGTTVTLFFPSVPSA
jgi:PAS domain S-box-containing protein